LLEPNDNVQRTKSIVNVNNPGTFMVPWSRGSG